MNCKYHSDQEAQAICEKCKNPICPACTIKVDDKTVCRHCIQQSLISDPIPVLRKTFLEKFLFLCYSLIPGAAHMHMGLFRRGLQFMIITFGVISLTSYIGLEFLIPIVVIPTWLFSFFESHHLRRQMEQGQTLSDLDLFDQKLFDYTPLLKNHRIIGSVITIIGILSLIRVAENYSILDRLFGDWNYYYVLKNSLVPLCLILGGIYLIIKAKQPPKVVPDIPED
ncbi:MAG TPA: hypothetical protein VN456_01075 [Desulfosporosinus sp.]|nr:hypothetical protein [Desulfosporosinus sp.]